MWSLPRPNIANSLAVRICANGMENTELRERLLASTDELTAMSDAYFAAASTAQSHSLLPAEFVLSDVSQAEMSWFYTQRLVSSQPGRRLYDAILLAPEHERCPLCRCGRATTLDHYLPKAAFAGVAVDPINLVPACKECNGFKLDRWTGDEDTTTFHPYFEQVAPEARWIHCEVMPSAPPTFRYRVRPPADWDATFTARVYTHFNTFKLARRYGVLAGSHYSGVRPTLAKKYVRGGRTALEIGIDDDIEGWEDDGLNSWQVALYRALRASNWFLDGGVLLK